jgi:RNA polymerase sigma-70 factor (ECF subfamily)
MVVSLTLADDVGRLAAVSSREEDFRVFYAQEYSRLAGYCWTLVRDRELAHDLAQEAFTRMLTRWRRIEDPHAYLYRVATNLVRKAWRARDRDQQTIAAARHDALTVGPGPDAGAVALKSAVGALPRRLRDVVMLHYFADLSVVDVSAALDRPAGTVKRQLAEARTLLAGALEAPHD